MARKIVVMLTAFVMLFAVVGLAGCSSDSNEDLLNKLLTELYALRAQVYALQTEVGDLRQQQQELLDRIAGLEREIEELTPWTEVPFTVRATEGVNWNWNDSTNMYFDHLLYETIRPEKYRAIDKYGCNCHYNFSNSRYYRLSVIHSLEELHCLLSYRDKLVNDNIKRVIYEDWFNYYCFEYRYYFIYSRLQDYRELSKVLLELYTEEFFIHNILVLYDWWIVAGASFNFIDTIRIRNTSLEINMSNYVLELFSGHNHSRVSFAIEISVDYVASVDIVKKATSYYMFKQEIQDYFWALPKYRDPNLTIPWIM